MTLEEKLKAKVIDEQLYYVSKSGQKRHCFDLLSLDDALSTCQEAIKEAKIEELELVKEYADDNHLFNLNERIKELKEKL